jgi:transcriptional regulator with XRE-family HTH domain
MKKPRTPDRNPMPYLRAWRDSLGLSRQFVVDQFPLRLNDDKPVDQATLAKWEKGETGVKAEHIEILAQIYGVTPDRLHFAPGDKLTPEMLKRAHEIIISRDPEAVARWLASGADLKGRENSGD